MSDLHKKQNLGKKGCKSEILGYLPYAWKTWNRPLICESVHDKTYNKTLATS